MKSNLIVLCSLTLFLGGCDAFKKLKGPPPAETPAAPSAEQGTAGAGAAAKPPEELCANGSKPQVFSGECGGNWKYVTNETGTVCKFEWGPKVTCPEGSVSLGHEAECYGATSKPVSVGDKVASEADCAAKYGKRPSEISYTMLCCPK